MKICWDNLENIKLTKSNRFYNPINRSTYDFVENCIICNEPFLKANCSKGMFCSVECRKKSKEWKRKLSESHKGRKLSDEHKRSLINANTGRRCSEETKKKIGDAQRGEKHHFYGKHHSESVRIKISEALKGKYTGKSSKLYGRILSNDHKKKISESNKGIKKSIEHRKNISKGRIKKYSNKNAPNWDGGYHSNGIPKYDTYAHQIEWCEIVRRNKDDRNILEIKCAYCGKWFVPTITNIRNRINFLKGLNGYNSEYRLYCSNSCKIECPIYHKKEWPKNFKQSTSREVQPELRQMVLERDDYQCIKCNSKESLHCHHIEGIRWNPIESADIDMCVTLCKTCHIEVHKLPDCGYNDMRCAA